jgi:hypothetical protein
VNATRRPSPSEIAAAAAGARAALEAVLQLLGWPHEVALSRTIDHLVQLEEAGQ